MAPSQQVIVTYFQDGRKESERSRKVSMEKKNALVLSGGSIKGAFQAGAIQAVIQSGFIPDFIYGISVGALNGSFLCNESGRQTNAGNLLDWNSIAQKLVSFWKDNVKRPSDVIKEKSWLDVGVSALFDNFTGLVDTSPLQSLVRKTISVDSLRASPVGLKVGAVDLINGDITYADSSYPDIVDYIIASSSTPIIMPVISIRGMPFVDGGTREIAPLKPAIESGAADIVVIACDSKEMGSSSVDSKDIIKLIERVFDVMSIAIVDDDVGLAQYINGNVPQDGTPALSGPFAGKRKVIIRVIRPSSPINLDITKFTSADIENLIQQGYRAASPLIV